MIYPPGLFGAEPLSLVNLEAVISLSRALGLAGVQRRCEGCHTCFG